MDELRLKLEIAEHIAKLRDLAKDAEDFTIRLQNAASKLEHRYRLLRERDTIVGTSVRLDSSIPKDKVILVQDDDIPF